MYEVFEHTADIGIRVQADSLDALMVDAARGLFSLIVTNLDQVKAVQEKAIRIDAVELDYLLFDWLNELLYTFEVEHLLFSEFAVHVAAGGLTATCRGEPMQLDRHAMDHEVKAITYHGLKVQQVDAGWIAELIVDI